MNDAVTLRTLKETANAMECEFIYAIAPKGTSTLEDIIKTRAEIIANERIARVAHTMALEDQALDENILLNQKSELARSLAKHLNKKLWSEQNHVDIKQKAELKNSIAESIYRHIHKINEAQYGDKNKRPLYNSPQFSKILNSYLSIEKNKKIGSALSKNLNNPKYIKELEEAIKLIMKKDEKEKNQKTEIFKKLIENLQKKK